MSSQQRIAVFRGDRLKTSGGLFKKDLIKNKRGKIVSRKKSGQARGQNNLGKWLRSDNEKVSKADMLRKGNAPPEGASKAKPAKAPQKAAPKPKAAPPKPKAAPKAVPKKVVAKPQAPQPRKKKKLPKGYNPITRQPYEKQSGLGYVGSGKVNLDNVTTMGKEKRRRRKRGQKVTRESILEAKRLREERLAEQRARQG